MFKTFSIALHEHNCQVHISNERVIVQKTCDPIRMVRIYQDPAGWFNQWFGLDESRRRPSCVS